MRFKSAIIAVLFLLAVLLSVRSLWSSKKINVTTTAVHSELPDAFIEQVAATIFNHQGKPTLKIEAPKMFHYHEKDTTQIEMPHIIVYRQSPEPWHIHANHATATHGIEQILFWDNVIISHQKDLQNPTTTIKTTALTIFPNKETAQTDRAVTLLQPNTKVFGIGMLANIKIGNVKLLSKTRSEYVPKS